jgi:AbrB family looped-hinge helix DNA binding protein
MQQITVGTKYQIVIPKEVRKKMKNLRPGSKVSINRLDEKTIAIRTEPSQWLERTKGMMTGAWKNINTSSELEKIRNEWEERLKEVEKNIK